MGDPALAITYQVTLDGFIPLGLWTKISGLSMEYTVTTYREGGVNHYEHKIIGPVKYGNVSMSRPVDSDSMLVQMWIQSNLIAVVPQTMSIAALNAAGEEITSWSLMGVVPIKWSGPNLDINGNGVAQETLEIAFEQIMGLGALGDLLGGLGISASLSVGF
jgi:phage tail-like protein